MSAHPSEVTPKKDRTPTGLASQVVGTPPVAPIRHRLACYNDPKRAGPQNATLPLTDPRLAYHLAFPLHAKEVVEHVEQFDCTGVRLYSLRLHLPFGGLYMQPGSSRLAADIVYFPGTLPPAHTGNPLGQCRFPFVPFRPRLLPGQVRLLLSDSLSMHAHLPRFVPIYPGTPSHESRPAGQLITYLSSSALLSFLVIVLPERPIVSLQWLCFLDVLVVLLCTSPSPPPGHPPQRHICVVPEGVACAGRFI